MTSGRLEESKFISKRTFLLCLDIEVRINEARFCMYQRRGLTGSLPSVVLFLVHETTNIPRIVAQEQNGSALTELLCEEHQYVTSDFALTLL